MRLIRAICAPVLIAFALTGCGGGEGVGGGTTAAETAATPTANISGTPATTVTAGSRYNFIPSASDSDGGALTFSISNAPAWATFNTKTGQLSGVPKASDAGTTSGIVITVADGNATAALPPFSITVAATATPGMGTARLSWVAPTQNSDGSALTNLAGYNIYYGTDSSALTQTIQVANAAALSYIVSGLATGTTWYFAVTSYTTGGQESAPSAISCLSFCSTVLHCFIAHRALSKINAAFEVPERATLIKPGIMVAHCLDASHVDFHNNKDPFASLAAARSDHQQGALTWPGAAFGRLRRRMRPR